jgi:hypothetical protein
MAVKKIAMFFFIVTICNCNNKQTNFAETALLTADKFLEQHLATQNKLSTRLSLPPGDYTDFTPLLEFENLEYLKIDNPLLIDISNIPVLIELNELKSLAIWAEKIADIRALASFTDINELSLSLGYYADASEFLSMLNLEKLSFSPASSESIENIAKLTNLKYLHLAVEGSGTDFSPLGHLINLTELSIQGESGDYEIDLSGFEKLHNLEIIRLNNFIITNIQPLINLPHLHLVDLRFSKVSEENILFLKTNKIIKEIDLYGDH